MTKNIKKYILILGVLENHVDIHTNAEEVIVMYLIEFFKRMTRKANIPILIYLVLNVFVIGGVISLLFAIPFWIAFLVGIVLYVISLFIALSPIGEWILRLQTGCKKIKDEEVKNFLEPLFNEVYAKAKAADPSISDKVQLYINEDEAPNAFATGRKTICVTKGLLNMPEEQIKATLAHEFGHLAHKDTDLILVVSVGNMIVNAIIVFVKVCVEIFHIFFLIGSVFAGGDEGFLARLFASLYRFLIMALITTFMWIWTKIGVLLVMKSSRSNEYEADEFAYNLGYGEPLCKLLESFGLSSGAKGLFANLSKSHPENVDRIAKLRSKGSAPQAAIEEK